MHSSRRDETARGVGIHEVRINNNVERDRSTQGCRCGYMPFSVRSGLARTGRNPSDVTQCDATATHNITGRSILCVQRAGRSIFHSPGVEELFATATCAHPRSRGGPHTSENLGTRATATRGKSRDNLNALFTVSHFAPFRIFPPSSPPIPSFLSLSFALHLANMAKIALFLYNAHIRRSYCNLVRSRFRVIGEEKYFHGCGTPTRKRWSSSLSFSSLCLSSIPPEIFLEAKITRSHKFTVKTESFSLVLVSPLSLSNIYRGSFCGRG